MLSQSSASLNISLKLIGKLFNNSMTLSLLAPMLVALSTFAKLVLVFLYPKL